MTDTPLGRSRPPAGTGGRGRAAGRRRASGRLTGGAVPGPTTRSSGWPGFPWLPWLPWLGQPDSGSAALAQPGLTPPRWLVWPRRAAYGLAGLAVVVPTGTAGAAWYFATQLVDASRAREYPLEIRSATGDEITMTRTLDTDRNVPLALHWAGGHAELGEVLSRQRGTVTRRITRITHGRPRAGFRAYTSSAIFDGDPRSARGLDFEEVGVPGELGQLPAWLVPPVGKPAGTWVVAAHGRGATRAEALRILPTLADLGLTTLVTSYRNDAGAPHSPDRRYHLGHTEARDVAAAVRYARERGASDVILYGWSMGGATVLNTLRLLPPGVVRAVVLDCPVIDWIATLRMQARQRNLPPPLTWAATRLIEQRVGVRLSELDQRRHAAELDVPVLIFLDGDDQVVDPRPTRSFAAMRPSLVTLVETAGGGHTRSWNRDPDRYQAALRTYLTARMAG